MSSKGYLRAAAAVAFTVLAGVASAGPALVLASQPAQTVGPQSTSNPCIIAGTNCSNPAGFGYNNFTSSGAISSYNMYSTTPTAVVPDGTQGTPYTVGQLTGVVGNMFDVAIDVNTTNAAGETLQLFEVIVNGAVWQSYVGPTPIGNISSNGNGYADWTLSRVDLSSFAAGATVLFHAVWNNASDGPESFFLVNGNRTPQQVAEPATLGLAGLALLALGAARRNRRA